VVLCRVAFDRTDGDDACASQLAAATIASITNNAIAVSTMITTKGSQRIKGWQRRTVSATVKLRQLYSGCHSTANAALTRIFSPGSVDDMGNMAAGHHVSRLPFLPGTTPR
jgi:hypothetical protein